MSLKSGQTIEIGPGHRLELFAKYNPEVDEADGRMGEPAIGAVHWHPDARDHSKECGGTIWFAGADAPQARAKWNIESEEPLTLSPSLLCRNCGSHGFIREGKWVPA